jgi:hypothetical protein
MMKFEIASHLGVSDQLSSVAFQHPNKTYEVHLQNHDMRPGIESQLLHAYVAFDADNIDVAVDLGRQHLGEFVDILGFATSVRFAIRHRIAIYQWDVGLETRQGKVFHSIADPSWPILALDASFAATIESFLAETNSEPIRRDLRWFRVAVSADPPDEQYQWFWFVIETLAALSSERKSVPDRCPRCHEPLYCQKCQKISTHRPYPSQEVKQLFEKHVSDDPHRAYKECSAMRHALLHGENIETVEKELDTTLSTLTDRVGKVAWVALLSHLRSAVQTGGSTSQLHLLQPSSYINRNLEAYANMTIGLKNRGPLTIADFPDANITLSASND